MPASLGAALGERFVAGGRVYYAAPTPERLAAAPLDAIRAAKLRYRDRYEEALAETVMSATDLEALKQAPGDDAWRELMRLTGVALTPPTSRSSVPLAARMPCTWTSASDGCSVGATSAMPASPTISSGSSRGRSGAR
jgi:hypothetical protein